MQPVKLHFCYYFISQFYFLQHRKEDINFSFSFFFFSFFVENIVESYFFNSFKCIFLEFFKLSIFFILINRKNHRNIHRYSKAIYRYFDNFYRDETYSKIYDKLFAIINADIYFFFYQKKINRKIFFLIF